MLVTVLGTKYGLNMLEFHPNLLIKTTHLNPLNNTWKHIKNEKKKMKIDVTNTKTIEVKKMIQELKKNHSDVHLKSTGTRKGRKTFIICAGKYKQHKSSPYKLTKSRSYVWKMVPSNIKEFAKRKGVLKEVNQIDRWLKKFGKYISGGTAIGKYYDTLVMDISYQDAAIYLDTDTNKLKLYGTPINWTWNDFKTVYLKNNQGAIVKIGKTQLY